MNKNTSIIKLPGVIGHCGNQKVFLGFASASLLYDVSFADILNEDTGQGYQRPYNKQHSLNFKEYISCEGSSTIPLTFNLRKELKHNWKIVKGQNSSAELIINPQGKSLAQVDCQHRLGGLKEMNISFAFMTFIGLDLCDEMAMFTVINGKAKGLSSSLTDYHESNLLNDLASEAPHLYISRRLNEDPDSPWFRLIRYGGETTSGLKRRTSFRMMQRAVHDFLRSTKTKNSLSLEEKYLLIRSFWSAVKEVFPTEWADHRHHLITKGIGLYSLMMLLENIVFRDIPVFIEQKEYENVLKKLRGKVDWQSSGTFSDAGGHKGAKEAYKTLKGLAGL